MPSVFKYQDYRKFLADYYEEKKAASPAFSYQGFSHKAGFSSKSFLFNVIKGRKTLSRASIVRMCEAMGLKRSESAYFENLVYFNQSQNFSERDFYFEKLNGIKPGNGEVSGIRKLRDDQYEFYSKWHHVVVRSLIDLFPTITDSKTMAKMVHPALLPKQARESIDLLKRLGLIAKKKNGAFAITDKLISTGQEIQSLAVQHFHLQCMELAARALKELPKNRRNISGLTLGISRKAYDKVCEEILLCQEKILRIAEGDAKSDEVYQLNFHLFPVSREAPAACRGTPPKSPGGGLAKVAQEARGCYGRGET